MSSQILNVPYLSHAGRAANANKRSDCGACCVAMLRGAIVLRGELAEPGCESRGLGVGWQHHVSFQKVGETSEVLTHLRLLKHLAKTSEV